MSVPPSNRFTDGVRSYPSPGRPEQPAPGNGSRGTWTAVAITLALGVLGLAFWFGYLAFALTRNIG